MDFLNKISVKARVTTLFVIFLIFFAFFGLFTLQKIGGIGDLTRTMYDHPLPVIKASLKAELGVMKMHRGMKDVSMATKQR